MSEVGRTNQRAGPAVMLSLAWLTVGCVGTDADPAPTAAAAPLFTATPTPELFTATPMSDEPPGGTGCGPDLALAVRSRSPGFGEIAVDRCQGGWAYLGAAEGLGDTEQLWRAEGGAWRWVTSMPSPLCPVDLQETEAPSWVIDLFAYRNYDC
jgi:hypothetical protein